MPSLTVGSLDFINGTCLFHAVFWLSFFLHGTCHCCLRVNLQRTYRTVFFSFQSACVHLEETRQLALAF